MRECSGAQLVDVCPSLKKTLTAPALCRMVEVNALMVERPRLL